MTNWNGVIDAYRDYLPFDDNTPIVTLNEGNTPLIPAPRLAEELAPGRGLRLFLKYEGLNPTGSFKDRGMTAAITQAVRERAQTVICASTGNTAASAAAYAARAGLPMRMAVASVSGFSTTRPRTMGAAPAACPPSSCGKPRLYCW